MKYYSVVVWDESLSKLIGKDKVAETSGGPSENDNQEEEDEEGDDDNTDDAMDSDVEPDTPTGSPALLGDIDFKYDPCDPAGLKLGQLSTHDATCHDPCHISGVRHKSRHISTTVTNSRPNYLFVVYFLGNHMITIFVYNLTC